MKRNERRFKILVQLFMQGVRQAAPDLACTVVLIHGSAYMSLENLSTSVITEDVANDVIKMGYDYAEMKGLCV